MYAAPYLEISGGTLAATVNGSNNIFTVSNIPDFEGRECISETAVAETVLENQRLKKVWACSSAEASAYDCRIKIG